MKRRILTSLALFGVVAASAAFIPSNASAFTLTTGSAIIAIDGDTDNNNVTVDILSTGGTSTYAYGYFLNGSSTFNNVSPFSMSTFQGGDVIDFALFDGSRYYTLSGDLLDASYSVLMTFDNQVTTGAPQQPVDWTKPYFYNANITWSLPTVINTNEYTLNFINNGNDGIASVPEPASILLVGSALVGYGLMRRRKKA
ncbi:MAG: PEP-CTERM sorting domain-containing protein [Deltaproteobacteria bacterium]|nr:PEP-CTERM sorting domain-containing protein [Deltaproteobacteria bacterium]